MRSFEYTFDAIGTRWHLIFEKDDTAEAADAIVARVKQRIDDYDLVYSRFRSDSLVTRMSHAAGTYRLPADAPAIMNLYHELYTLTGGAMTPLIGDVLSAAGYDATYSLQSGELHTPPPWEEVIEYDGHTTLTLKKPTMLDFGAAGKGYLVDIVGELLEASEIRTYCIDAGGDIRQRSASDAASEIGLENPHDFTEAVGIVRLQNKSVCGSAGNRRVWGQFHHIINPYTLASPRHLAAVWVVASSTLLADALATALFFTSPEILTVKYQFEYVLLFADNSARSSSGFPGELFTQ